MKWVATSMRLPRCLQFEVFALQIAQQGGVVGQEHVGIVGDGTGGQAQGLHMVDLHEAVDGAAMLARFMKGSPR
jgi:hypothetical protein